MIKKKKAQKKCVHKKEVSKTKKEEFDDIYSKPTKRRVPRKPRSRKFSIDRMYFTKETENAIVKYNNTEDDNLREKIFNSEIKYPLEKLVENIFNTFKFSYLETGPLEAQKETVSHLVLNISKFNPDMGFKAYSYFSIVAKNFLIALNTSNYKRFNKHVDISEDHEENTIQLQSEDAHYKQSEISEFMKLMVKFWESNVKKIFPKHKDLNVANAVIELFRNSDRIDAFNKKALYLYIREISSCKTSHITKVINKMKQHQSMIYQTYVNEGTVDIE